MKKQFLTEREFVQHEIDKVIIGSTAIAWVPQLSFDCFEQLFGLDRGSTTRFGKADESYTDKYDVYSAMKKVQDKDLNVIASILHNLIAATTIVIFARFEERILLCECSLCNFFRRFRNAVAHADKKWEYYKKYEASWRQWSIDDSYPAHSAFIEFGEESCPYSLRWGDAIELWLDVADHMDDRARPNTEN